MKKILFFIPNLSVGGAEKVLVNLVNNMDRSKFDITVQVLFSGGVNEQFLKKGIKLIHCYKKTFRGNSQVFKLFSPSTLYNRFIKEHYDIVVSYLEGPTARIVSGCTDKNTKLVSWIHCQFDSPATAAVGFRNFNEAKEAFNRYDRIISVSQWVKDSFCKTLNYSKCVDVLYNTNESQDIIHRSNEPVNEVAINHGVLNLCAVGKIEPVKGFDRLVRIQKRLLDSGIKSCFYILGIGAQKAELESMIKQYGIEDSFLFLGYQTNPYKFVAECDLFVCSSLSEGFSTATTEALIVGIPVCTVEVSGMKELLGEHNEYGIVTENREDSLYEGIKSLLDDPKLLNHYKKQAGVRGKEFSKEKTVKAVEDMLLGL